MSDFTEFVNLASDRLGGVVLAANDEFFAPKENLLKSCPPVFFEDKYTDRGKWMDGWETRRRRTPGHDWCVIKLGLPGVLRGVLVDTSYFKGNYPEACSLEACAVDAGARTDELLGPSTRWMEVLPRSALQGDAQNLFAIDFPHRVTHIRFNIFPDGGVARLQIYGEVVPDRTKLHAHVLELDLAALETGGRVLGASDMFFGSRHNLIMPGPAKDMREGWETRRRRGPGYDWVIIKLATAGLVRRVEVDTTHFKGNAPESCALEGCDAEGASLEQLKSFSVIWQELLPRVPLQPDTQHGFEKEVKAWGAMTHVRFNIYPDGGVARLRLYGNIRQERHQDEGLRRLNALTDEEAEAALLACCGAHAWARRLTRRRPFPEVADLFRASNETWWALGQKDWQEAFRAHPRIGEKKGAQEVSPAAQHWSEAEQAGTRGANAELLAALREASRAYEARFGHLFIVCATGKTTEEMLALLHQRLHNDPDRELRIAAEEQRRITNLRLEKLLQP